MDALNEEEVLFVGTADAEHTEMYLKAIWHIPVSYTHLRAHET